MSRLEQDLYSYRNAQKGQFVLTYCFAEVSDDETPFVVRSVVAKQRAELSQLHEEFTASLQAQRNQAPKLVHLQDNTASLPSTYEGANALRFVYGDL